MRTIKIVVAAGLAVAAAASPCFADDGPGIRVGIGGRERLDHFPFNRTMTAAVELPYLRFEIAGSVEVGDDDRGTSLDKMLSVAVLPTIARRGAVTLRAGVRVGSAWTRAVDGSHTRMHKVAVPVSIEADVTRWLSLDVEGSLDVMTSYPGEDVGPAVYGGTQAIAGFTVWL